VVPNTLIEGDILSMVPAFANRVDATRRVGLPEAPSWPTLLASARMRAASAAGASTFSRSMLNCSRLGPDVNHG
jgi:hypothetical protein